MTTYNENLLPTTTGFNLGSSSQRWDVFAQDLDIAGTFSIVGRMAVKNFEGILFADQFAGATPADQLDAAVTAAAGGLVIAPPDMGAGFGVIPGTVLDLRSGQFSLYSNGYTTANFALSSAGIVSGAFISGSASVAGSGTIRLGSTDTIKFRVGILDKKALEFSGNTVIVGNAGVQLNGAVTFTGAASGITTLSMSGQLTSSLATGTAPFSITSTTLVSNLNVATLNGVTVSGAPTSGQILAATSATTAGWSSTAGSAYKLESLQYTPVTFVSSAGGAYFTYSLPSNELAVGQALRFTFTGTWTNTSVATRTYTFTLKAGATTLLTWTLVASNANVTNSFMAKQLLLICTAAGASGTVEVQAIDPPGPLGGMTDPTSMTGTANTATIAFDTTTSQSLTINVTQTNDATTATTGRQFMVERLG